MECGTERVHEIFKGMIAVIGIVSVGGGKCWHGDLRMVAFGWCDYVVHIGDKKRLDVFYATAVILLGGK